MEISNEMLIDVALNVVGFVLAGLLTAVIYSMFGRKDKSATSFDQYGADGGNIAMAPSRGRAGGKIEFIDFQSKGNSSAKPALSNVNSAGESSQFQRNRLEVIKQASEMLNGGKMTQDIRRNLAMTDSDLQILNQGRKVLAKRGAANDQ